MPKSRKTKAKYKDFQKVKLKIGKKLPKADNVTDTSFKSRGIHIKEQLKGASFNNSTDQSAKRGHNFKELLSHCHHHNITARHEALTGLREVVTEDPSLLQTHLAALLEHVPDLCIDKDGVVRHAVHKFFKVALPHIPEDRMAPFFGVLSAHLCCAMTHIDDEIQMDSLVLFDLFMEHYPHLLVTSNSSVLTNFIEQISRKSSSNSAGAAGVKGGGRALLVNPNSKMSSRKGRVQVLGRLHKFLSAVIEQKQPLASSQTQSIGPVEVNANQVQYYQPKGSTWTNINDMHRFRDSGQSTATASGMELLSNSKKLSSLLDTLLPLMLQCWIEVGPGQLSTNLPGNVMSRDAMSTLGNILKVIHLLLKCVDLCEDDSEGALMQTAREKYLTDFVQHYLPCFPYSMHEAPVSEKKKPSKADQPSISILVLNLTVCEVMAYFAPTTVEREPPSWLRKLTTFAVQSSKQSLDFEQLQILLRFLGKLMDCKLDNETQEEVMTCACNLFISRHRSSRDRLQLLDFITGYITLPSGSHLLNMTSVVKWMESLPRILVQSYGQNNNVTSRLICVIRRIAPLGQQPLLDALQQHCGDLIGIYSQMPVELQSRVVEVMYWVPCWSKRHLQALAKTSHVFDVSHRHFHKLALGLVYRYQKEYENEDQNFVFDFSDFFSFILTVLVGKSSDELLKESVELNEDMLHIWKARMDYSQTMSNILLLFHNTSQVTSLLNSVIVDVFEKYCGRLPVFSVISLLSALIRTHKAHLGIVPSQPPIVISALVAATCGVITSAAESSSDAPSQTTVKGSINQAVTWQGVRATVLSTCTELLSHSPDSIIGFVGEVLHVLTECTEERPVYSCTYILRHLLHDAKLRPAMISHTPHLQTAVDQLEGKIQTLQSQIWWSDLKYEVSLINPKKTLR